MEEFYGPEYALFKSNEAITVHDMIKKNPLKKDSITRHLGEVVNSILEKGTCNIATVSIVHRAVLEYLLLAEDKAIQDMIDLLKDHLVHILHTREGARVAQLCILHSTSKNRKHIIKSFKGFVGKIAREQYGHAALITCFECVDDTVLLQKAIMAELLKDGTEGPNDTFVNLLRSKFGSRLVLYILMGRNRKYQPAYLVNELDEMDVVRAKTSKKDDALRKKELLDAISAPLLTAIENHANELLRDRQGGQVVSETLRLAVGDKSKAIHAVASLTAETPDAMEKEDEDFKKKEAFHAVKALKAQADKARLEETIIMDDHILVNRNATFALKDILSGGNRGKDASTTSQGNAAFAQALFDQIQSRLSYWINYCIQDPLRSSGTAFVLFNMMENAESNLRKTLKTEVKTILSKMKNVDAQISSKKAQGQSEKIQVTKNTNNKKRKKGQDASPNDTPVRKTAVEMLLDASRA